MTDWRTQAGELVVRYEPRYPGWKPGCAEQFEHEDHYRLASAGGLALSRRQVANGWHRELGVAADRLFRALAEEDARTLGLLVPAPALRARLPKGLGPEPVCEQAAAGPARAGHGGGHRAARRPARALGAHLDARSGRLAGPDCRPRARMTR